MLAELRQQLSRAFMRARGESSSIAMPDFYSFDRSPIIPSFCPSDPTFAFIGTPGQFRANNDKIIAEVATIAGFQWPKRKGDVAIDVFFRWMLGQVNKESLPGQLSLLFYAPVATSEESLSFRDGMRLLADWGQPEKQLLDRLHGVVARGRDSLVLEIPHLKELWHNPFAQRRRELAILRLENRPRRSLSAPTIEHMWWSLNYKFALASEHPSHQGDLDQCLVPAQPRVEVEKNGFKHRFFENRALYMASAVPRYQGDKLVAADHYGIDWGIHLESSLITTANIFSMLLEDATINIPEFRQAFSKYAAKD